MKRAEIKRRALTSLRWTGLLAAFNLLSNFLFKVMLARFLLPADFGNLSIAMATMTIAVMLASLGMPQTIVAKEGLSRQQLSAMFAMSVLAALVLAITLGILAPTFGRFFDMNQLETLVRIVAPTIVGMCCLQLFLCLLQRELRADLVAQLQIGRNLTCILVTLVMLLMGMGVSAVLWAHLTAAWIWVLVSASILLRRGEWPFSWRMRVTQLGGKIQFGCTVWAKELTNEVAVRLDEIIIGSLLRPEILGFYYFGKSLLEALRRMVSSSFAQVTLPLFAKLSADTEALRSVYNKLTFSVAMVALPLFTICGALAHLYVPLLFGQKWAPAVIVIQIFSGAMVIKVLTANISTYLLYVRFGEMAVLVTELVSSGLYLIALLIVAQYGLLAVLISYVIFIYGKNLTLQVRASKAIGSTILAFGQNLRHPVYLSILLLAMVATFLQVLPKQMLPTVQLTIVSMLSVTVAVLYYWSFERERTTKTVRTLLRLS